MTTIGKIPGFNRLILASESPIKLRAVSEFFGIPENEILCKNTSDCELPEQPFNSGLNCCFARKNHVLGKLTDREKHYHDHIICIENEIRNECSFTGDICHVVIYNIPKAMNTHINNSKIISFPLRYFEYVKKHTTYSHKGERGFSITIGQAIKLDDPDIDDKNWMSSGKYNLNHQETGYTCRFDQIVDALESAFPIETERYKIGKHISLTPDFPKPGVVFKDLSLILADSNLFHRLIDLSVKIIETSNICGGKGTPDKIVGLDSRGFIYGTALAYRLNSGFVMARKGGKLPCKTEDEKISVRYSTEYSTDNILEILKSTVEKGDRVLIVDDLMATGGSFKAASDLVEQAGGVVVGYLAILKVDFFYEKAVELLSGKESEKTPILIVL